MRRELLCCNLLVSGLEIQQEKVEEPVTRMVIIEPGTAQTFFEVVSDSLPPFVVQGYRDPCIRNVFNTQAYSDELTTKTTLLRGRVLVRVNNLSLKRVLEPVLQASWSTGTDEIIVKNVNMDIQFDKRCNLRSVINKTGFLQSSFVYYLFYLRCSNTMFST